MAEMQNSDELIAAVGANIQEKAGLSGLLLTHSVVRSNLTSTVSSSCP